MIFWYNDDIDNNGRQRVGQTYYFYYGVRIMSYYTITNTVGESIDLANGAHLVIGDVHEKKTKSGKDSGIVLAFSKTDDGWLFNGWATVDYDVYCDEMTEAELQPLAYRSSIIDLQRDMRPGKSSKKIENKNKFDELSRQLAAGEIDIAAFQSQIATMI
jgi:hypothetical protein